MQIREIMTPDPMTVTPETPTAEARAILEAESFRHLPVVRGHEVVGVVTTWDLVGPRETVGEVMSKDVISVGPEAGVDTAAATMAVHKVACLPVIERGALVGIVTTYDLLDALVRWLRDHGTVDAEGTPY